MDSESRDGKGGIIHRLLIIASFMWLTLSLVSGRLCTEVKTSYKMKEVEVGFPCTQKYSARCGWLSLEYCTYYHQTVCKKLVNQTVTFYYAQTWCCPGFVMAENSTCIVSVPGVKYITPRPRMTYEDSVPETRILKMDEKKEIIVSPGGYAGIVSAFVFMGIIIFFIIYGVRKRQKSKQEKDRAIEEETAQELIARRLATSPSTEC